MTGRDDRPHSEEPYTRLDRRTISAATWDKIGMMVGPRAWTYATNASLPARPAAGPRMDARSVHAHSILGGSMKSNVTPTLITDPVSPEDLRQASSLREESGRSSVALVLWYRAGVTWAPLLPEHGTVVGREEADISIPDSTLSRRHACFTVSSGKLIVEDLGSRHGTWMDERRIARESLDIGEEVRMGLVFARSIDPSWLARVTGWTAPRSLEEALSALGALAESKWRLTPRESQVLTGVARGKTNKEIACELRCEEVTVEAHVTRLLKKGAASNRTELTSLLWSLAVSAKSLTSGDALNVRSPSPPRR